MRGGLILVLAMVGCQGAPLANPLTIAAEDYDAVYVASIDALRDAGFVVDQRNHRFGRVTARPKGSPTVLEIWRGDNSTMGQAWMSTLADVRRRVRIELDPIELGDDADGPGGVRSYALTVTVRMQRRQAPVRRLTGSMAGGVFSELAVVPIEWRRRGITGSYWQTISRDAPLEQRLLRRIAQAAGSE